MSTTDYLRGIGNHLMGKMQRWTSTATTTTAAPRRVINSNGAPQPISMSRGASQPALTTPATAAKKVVLAYTVGHDQEHTFGGHFLQAAHPESKPLAYLEDFLPENDELRKTSHPQPSPSDLGRGMIAGIRRDLIQASKASPTGPMVFSVNLHSDFHPAAYEGGPNPRPDHRENFLGALMKSVNRLITDLDLTDRFSRAGGGGRIAMSCGVNKQWADHYPLWTIPSFGGDAHLSPSINLTPWGWTARLAHGGMMVSQRYDSRKDRGSSWSEAPRNVGALQAEWMEAAETDALFGDWLKNRDTRVVSDLLGVTFPAFLSDAPEDYKKALARVNKLLGLPGSTVATLH